jgi:hypothetical protein
VNLQWLCALAATTTATATAAAAEKLLSDIMRVRITLRYRVLAAVPLHIVVGHTLQDVTDNVCAAVTEAASPSLDDGSNHNPKIFAQRAHGAAQGLIGSALMTPPVVKWSRAAYAATMRL